MPGWLLIAAQEAGVRWNPQNILDSGGPAIALLGMLIVFIALTLITVFIAVMPALLKRLDPWIPAGHDHHAPHHAPDAPEDEEAIVAAISMVMHRRRSEAQERG